MVTDKNHVAAKGIYYVVAKHRALESRMRFTLETRVNKCSFLKDTRAFKAPGMQITPWAQEKSQASKTRRNLQTQTTKTMARSKHNSTIHYFYLYIFPYPQYFYTPDNLCHTKKNPNTCNLSYTPKVKPKPLSGP